MFDKVSVLAYNVLEMNINVQVEGSASHLIAAAHKV